MSEWISVKDRLPEQPLEIIETKRYWCALEGCDNCELVSWAHTNSGYHQWIWNDDLCASITHWMELPGPPQEDNKETVTRKALEFRNEYGMWPSNSPLNETTCPNWKQLLEKKK